MMKADAEAMSMIAKSQLSEEAKMAAMKLAKLEQQNDLTEGQMIDNYSKILHDLKPEVRQELHMFMDTLWMDMMNKMMNMDMDGKKEADMMMTTPLA